jgi:hypothetical protein
MGTRTLTVALVILGSLATAQDVKPNFAGVWKPVGGIRNAETRIEQTDSTFAFAPAIEGAAHMIVYPTDGRTTKEQGRRKITRTGHWEGRDLILESTGTFRFRRRTTREVISLSEDGRTMKMSLRHVGSVSRDDHDIVLERVGK